MSDKAFEDFVAGLKADPEAIRKRLLDASPEFLDGLHGAIGLAGEAGELLDAYKRALVYGAPLDKDNVLEECGDALHYCVYVLGSIDKDLDEAKRANIRKLKKRYPDGFSGEAALERADKAGNTEGK